MFLLHDQFSDGKIALEYVSYDQICNYKNDRIVIKLGLCENSKHTAFQACNTRIMVLVNGGQGRVYC